MSCGPKNDTRIELIMKFFPDGWVPTSSLGPAGPSISDLAGSMSWFFVWTLEKNDGDGEDAEDVAVLREVAISGVVLVVCDELLLPFASVN